MYIHVLEHVLTCTRTCAHYSKQEVKTEMGVTLNLIGWLWDL